MNEFLISEFFVSEFKEILETDKSIVKVLNSYNTLYQTSSNPILFLSLDFKN